MGTRNHQHNDSRSKLFSDFDSKPHKRRDGGRGPGARVQMSRPEKNTSYDRFTNGNLSSDYSASNNGIGSFGLSKDNHHSHSLPLHIAAYRPATPNKNGQYSATVMSKLESQNDEQLDGITAKVRILKDISVAIGDEIRSSSALSDSLNDSFETTRVRMRGTMNAMLRMADRTGVGWKVWLGFFTSVVLLFWYVLLT